jgi:hypothetical protein
MAARERNTLKATATAALTDCFSQKEEDLALLMAADKTFGEWDNEDDQVYDAL